MRIFENFPLKEHNTFAVDCRARFYVEINCKKDLLALISSDTWKANRRLILGGGSNVLFLKDFEGLIIQMKNFGLDWGGEEKFIEVNVGAGENWDKFVSTTVKNDWGGLENLSLIPGTVGAAPFQNIGAYGVEIKDYISHVEVFDLQEKTFRFLSNETCKFSYRDSLFKSLQPHRFIIWSVNFRLNKPNYKPHLEYGAIKDELTKLGISRPSIHDVRQVVCSIRQSKLPDPKIIPNGGSFFKNPVVNRLLFQELKAKFQDIVAFPLENGNYKLAAGWLISHLGWKGRKFRQAGVYEKQALVLVNHGNATGEEIFELSEQILQNVKQTFGIELEREIRVIS